MTQTAHSIAYYEEVIASQAQVINYERARRKQLEDIIANKKLPINLRQATVAIKKLVDTGTPNEDGWYRTHLPNLADTGGSSASTMSRAVRNFADCTGAIEIRKVPDKNDPFKEIIYIKPTEILDRPADIVPIKDIKRHGGDHRIARCNGCGSENIIEKKYQVCGDCGEVYKTFDDRPVNTPLQDATRESEEEETDASPHCILQSIPVDTLDATGSQKQVAFAELQALPQWVCWRYEENEQGKPTKVPYIAELARWPLKAKSNDPTTWRPYEQAQAIYEQSQREGWKYPYEGIGFMFNHNGIVGIDQDGNLDPRIDSYTETSVSGTGIHTYARGTIPRNVKRPGIEMYDHARFFCWTGKHLPGTPEMIEDCQAALDTLYKELVPDKIIACDFAQPPPQFTCSRSDDEILKKARDAKNGAKFIALYDQGRWKAYGYPSQSEADEALCRMLAYWADGDVSTIDRLFRKSRLYRDKWERDDYREDTIRKAIDQNWQVAS